MVLLGSPEWKIRGWLRESAASFERVRYEAAVLVVLSLEEDTRIINVGEKPHVSLLRASNKLGLKVNLVGIPTVSKIRLANIVTKVMELLSSSGIKEEEGKRLVSIKSPAQPDDQNSIERTEVTYAVVDQFSIDYLEIRIWHIRIVLKELLKLVHVNSLDWEWPGKLLLR